MNTTTAVDFLSSSIDWCEINFVYTPYVAEFWNSLTSLFICVNGMVGMYYYPDVALLYATLVPIGLTSCYFHLSLSLLGQILDEFSIMFAIVVSLQYINLYIYRICNAYLLCLANGVQILLIFGYPEYNRLFLFIYGFYLWKIFRHMRVTFGDELSIYIATSEILFIFSFCFWLIDYIFCVTFINFHALWHILIGCVAYYLFKSIFFLNHIENFHKNNGKMGY